MYVEAYPVTLSSCELPVLPSWERSHIPSHGIFKDDLSFPKVGYVSFMEGNNTTCTLSDKNLPTNVVSHSLKLTVRP